MCASLVGNRMAAVAGERGNITGRRDFNIHAVRLFPLALDQKLKSVSVFLVRDDMSV